MKEIRLLRADEIDARIATCNQYGVSILLYKDARCDMNILDETFGSMNWQRRHCRDNQNCIVSIWDEDKKQWIEKEDTGTESFTEKEKGLASDSFKRACFNWGIGRELYTAPNMFVNPKDLKKFKQDERGKWVCKDYFKVSNIQYIGRRICYVAIRNESTGRIIEFGQPAEYEKKKSDYVEKKYITAVRNTIKKKGLDEAEILNKHSMKDWNNVPAEKYNAIVTMLKGME